MIDNKEKDIIKLWWEYLKRSERYREFCKWWNQKEKSPLPDSLNKYHQGLWNTYMNFGDVHSQSFEEWWRSELDNPLPVLIKPYYAEFGKNMIDYRSVIEKDIYKIHRKFKKKLGREPNIKELIHNLKLYMAFWKRERLYLLVEFQHASKIEIVEEFHDFLSDRKKDPTVKEASKSIRGSKGITTIIKKPTTTDELERYLRAYDYRKDGRNYSEIAKEMWEISNDDDDYSEDTERIVKRDLQKAKKIISNVEYGYFPGKF
jgi:hypothetical protein